jgi:chromosome segregation ATPase
MTPRAIAVLTALLLAAFAPTAATLRAQQDPPSAAQSKQQLAEGKFKELTDRMRQLMVVLQKDEPEESKLLGAGLRYVQEKKVQQRLELAAAMLKQERWDEGLVVMGKLREDLRSLLELLQNRNGDLRKLLERIDQLEGFKDRVDELAKEQQQEKEDSARAEAVQKHLKNIEAQRERAEELLNQQQALRDQTNQLPLDAAAGQTEPLEQREGELKAAADELSKDLRDLDKEDAELKDAASDPAAAEPAPSKPSDGSPSAGKSSSSAGKAAASMGKAQEQLGDKQPEPALKDQDQAIEALKQTMKELDAMAEEARRELLKLPFDELAKKQQKTQQATDTLSKDMEKAEQGEEGSEGEPTPGKNKVQQAVPKQRAAAGQLKEFKPAKQKQQDAKDDLEAAKQALEEALKQLRQQLQDEVLRALEERFTAMLARQRELTIMTKTVDASRKNILTADGQLPTALVSKIEALAEGEGELELETIDALKLLEEDGTTAVFPPMVEQLREELHDVAVGLRARRTGAVTNQAQKDVEDLLELLINALRRTIEKKEGGG